MLSAFLELWVISQRWDNAFTWDGEAFSSTGEPCSPTATGT